MRDVTVLARTRITSTGSSRRCGRSRGVEVQHVSDRTFLLHLGGKIEVDAEDAAEDARRPLDGVHAGRRPRLQAIADDPDERLDPDDQAQHGRRRQRRHRGARPRRHRAGGGDAGDGGQGDAVQGVRRHRRVPDLPGHEGRRRDRRDRHGDRAGLRRHQPRGHLRAALLRDRGAPARRRSTFRSSTTTSTARRSSSWRRC